ncbi:unnamed protein product [Cylicocyclus nassatus]|uniref:Uncharacterized protein n=1 Tax=Cylicocyclus nassatus TaxID=53992 RepID=A0AA36DTF4_CYLNA|nr:unnamed protein product [Cylicocyclus nassatus]
MYGRITSETHGSCNETFRPPPAQSGYGLAIHEMEEELFNDKAGQTAFYKHTDAKTHLSTNKPSAFETEISKEARQPAASRKASDEADDEEKTDNTREEVELVLTISNRKISATNDSQACAGGRPNLVHWPAENEDEREYMRDQVKLMDPCEAEKDIYRSTYDMVMNGLAEWKVKSEELQRENENFRILAASAEQV